MESIKNKLCVALDVTSEEDAFVLATMLHSRVGYFKVGSELFTRQGPRIIEILKAKDAKVFLDLKYHDIPNTVKKSVIAAIDMGVDIINMHSLGGYEMMYKTVQGVKEHCAKRNIDPPVLIGVTVLTSMDTVNLKCDLLVGSGLDNYVLHLAYRCHAAGLDGVVCSSQELSMIRKELGREFFCITPGIRLPTGNTDDQKRIMTPYEAIQAGSDLLVVGRPITEADDPIAAAQLFLDKMEHV